MAEIPALKDYRKRNDLSQVELGEMVGVCRMTVFRWEKGIRKIDNDKLPLVSEITGIQPSILRPDLAALFNEPAQ